MVDNLPERDNRSFFSVKKILKKTYCIQRQWISITLAIFANLCDPIVRFCGIDHLKQRSIIEKGPARVIQNSKVIGFYPNYNIMLIGREIGICSILFSKLDNHSGLTRFCFNSMRPMSGCSYQ